MSEFDSTYDETMRSEQPHLLILETSGRVGRVALALGAALGETRTLDETRKHGRDLAPAIAALCSVRGWRPRELDAVIVSHGPGSYTGLRVGVMSAKALAYATGCAVLAVETFAAIAQQAPPEAKQLDVLADAQQQNLYAQRWQRDATGVWQSATPLTIVHASAWLAGLAPGIWVSGPGLIPWETKVPELNRCVPPELRDPLPASLLKLGLRRWQAGEADDPWALEPLYLRRSNAEVNWDKRLEEKRTTESR